MTNNFELAIESLEELQTLNQNTLGELFNHCLEFKGNEQKVRSEDLALALYERLNPPGVDTHNLYLNRAIQYRKKAIAEKIIAMEKDIKPNQTLMLGHSLLQGAIYARWTDIAACLIDKGADINWIDSSMITPLKSAASGGDLELVKKIVAKGGNILFSEKRMPGVWRMPGHNYNRTALSFAAANGHVAVAQFLLEQEPKLPLDEPLWQACSNGQYEMANLLLDKGASAEKVSVHPLIKQKQYALAIRCIEAKATLPGYFGHEFSDPEADSWLLSLIKNGADVHWVSLDCETSLMLAAKKGNPNIVEALMSKGVDGSKIDKCGNNALHHALNAQADAKIVALLLEYGVDPNQPNKQGLTPIELAEQKGLQDLCDLFAQQGSLNKHAAA